MKKWDYQKTFRVLVRRCLSCCCLGAGVVNVFASIESLTVTCPRFLVSPHHYYVCLTKSAVTTTTTTTNLLSFRTFNGNKKGFCVFTGGLSPKFTRPAWGSLHCFSRTDYRSIVDISVLSYRPVGLALFSSWVLLLSGSLPALCFILLTEEMFSQSGV